MAFRMTVPLVLQQATMECWYASACMVAYYRRPGPRLGLPDKWIPNRGVSLADFSRLASTEGLKSVHGTVGDFSPRQLEALLQRNGPIWCAGRWDGLPHIVVLTGVDDKSVYINDPSPSRRQRIETLAWFNSKLDRVPNCMMYMPA